MFTIAGMAEAEAEAEAGGDELISPEEDAKDEVDDAEVDDNKSNRLSIIIMNSATTCHVALGLVDPWILRRFSLVEQK